MIFDDIAAYTDKEVSTYINAMLNEPSFVNVLKKVPALPKLFGEKDFDSLIKRFKSVNTINDFQSIMFTLLNYNVNKTTDGLTYSGIENLPKDEGILFISNHRSTSLDAGYINYILHLENRDTMYNGAGDNIFETEWLGHLIRINKGFIIKRDVEEIDEKIYEAKRLSAYINKLLTEKNTVWIAHRVGRAKNGSDDTDSVVISMLTKHFEKVTYRDWLESINFHPVSISWEVIPCDLLLAQHLAGQFDDNAPFQDRNNILYEIEAWKGKVHISFCKKVVGDKRNEIVNKVDKEIQSAFKLWDANWFAYLKLNEVDAEDEKIILKNIDTNRAEKIFNRAENLSVEVQQKLYEMYANPVINKLKFFPDIKSLF